MKNSIKYSGLYAFCWLSTAVNASSLPTVDVPGSANPNDYIATTKEIVFAVLGVIVLLVVGVGFIMMAKNSLTAFNDWRTGKAEFFTLGTTVGAAIALLVAILFFMGIITDSLGL